MMRFGQNARVALLLKNNNNNNMEIRGPENDQRRTRHHGRARVYRSRFGDISRIMILYYYIKVYR